MKAMILAAGKCTRMRPITFSVPKPMMPVLGRPVIETVIDQLSRSGVRQIMINTSDHPVHIQGGLGDGHRFGVQLCYSFEGTKSKDGFLPTPIGSAGGIRQIQEFSKFFDVTFAVVCGDAIIDLDFSKALDFHRKHHALATVVLHDVARDEVSKYGVVKLGADGRVAQFQEKPKIQDAISCVANSGIYIFEPKVIDYIPHGVAYDIGSQLLPDLVSRGERLYGYKADFNWITVGELRDYHVCLTRLLKNPPPNFAKPGNEVLPGVFVGVGLAVDFSKIHVEGPVYIGSGTCIEPGARLIGPTAIGANCHIEASATIERSFIDDYKRVKVGARITDQVVFGSNIIHIDGTYEKIAHGKWALKLADVRESSVLGNHSIDSLLTTAG